MFDLSTNKYSKLVSDVMAALGKFKAATKQLKLQKMGAGEGRRRLVISTNLLDTVGMHEGRLIVERILGVGAGLVIKPAVIGDTDVKRVYGRNYKNRSTERETMLQIASQKVLNEAIGDAQSVHITFMHEEIIIKPITEAQQSDTGATYTLGQDGFSGVVEAVELIKRQRFAEIQYTVAPEFDADVVTLFSIQLRRLGYSISETATGYLAKLGEAKEFSPLVTVPPAKSFRFNWREPKSVFAACTSGIDVYAMEKEGFKTKSILEWRPQEKRDVTDKTEVGAINALCNSQHVALLINEDIYAFNMDNLSPKLQQEMATNVFHISLQCDDFSSLKTLQARREAIENLSTTQDMIFPALDIIKRTNPPVVVVENVANFATSAAYHVFAAQMLALGYEVEAQVLNAKDFNGYTGRARCFVVASKLPVPFTMPVAELRTVHAGAELVEAALATGMLRDVSHTVSVVKGIETGRIRVLNKEKAVAPTLTKSQSRQTKDSCYFELDGKYYLPSESLQMRMMGIGDDFNFIAGTAEDRSEMIGQSVDVPTHSKLMRQIHKHLVEFVLLAKARMHSHKAYKAPLAASAIRSPLSGRLVLF